MNIRTKFMYQSLVLFTAIACVASVVFMTADKNAFNHNFNPTQVSQHSSELIFPTEQL